MLRLLVGFCIFAQAVLSYNIDILLPSSGKLEKAAAELAFEDLERNGILEASDLSAKYSETNCSSSAIIDIIRDLQLARPSDAIIGPFCDGECAVSWPYVDNLNILQLAYSCEEVDEWDDGFSRTVRVANPHLDKLPALLSTLHMFHWTKIAILLPMRTEWADFSGEIGHAFQNSEIDCQALFYEADQENIAQIFERLNQQDRRTVVFAGNALENSHIGVAAGALEPLKWAFIALNVHLDDAFVADDPSLGIGRRHFAGFIGIDQVQSFDNFTARLIETAGVNTSEY